MKLKELFGKEIQDGTGRYKIISVGIGTCQVQSIDDTEKRSPVKHIPTYIVLEHINVNKRIETCAI